MNLSPLSVAFILLLAGILVIAAVATTILGWVAVAQIRRSAGRLYGLGLALFDGLLFPLLALDALLAGLIHSCGVGILGWSRNYGESYALAGLLTALLFFVVDLLIIRAVWRAVQPAAIPSAPKEYAPAAAVSSAGHARLALGLLLLGLLGTPLLMALSPRHEYALAFGGLALLLALVFGMIGSSRLARRILIAVLTLLVVGGVGLSVIFYMRSATMQTAARNREFARQTAERASIRQVRFAFTHPEHNGGIVLTIRERDGRDTRWTPGSGQPMSLKEGARLQFKCRIDTSTPGVVMAWVSTAMKGGDWETKQIAPGTTDTPASLDFANGLHVAVSLLPDETYDPGSPQLPTR